MSRSVPVLRFLISTGWQVVGYLPREEDGPATVDFHTLVRRVRVLVPNAPIEMIEKALLQELNEHA